MKITGFKELEDALKKLPEELRRSVEISALRDGGKEILSAAKAKVPTGDNGLLKKSLGVVVRKNKSGALRGKFTARIGARTGFAITKGNRTKGKNAGKPIRHDPSKYVHLVELGTSHSAAKPFIRPAMDAAAGNVMGALAKGYDRGFARAVAKIRKP